MKEQIIVSPSDKNKQKSAVEVFENKIPSRTVFVRYLENVTKETEIKQGGKVAKDFTAHWSNEKSVAMFEKSEQQSEISFSFKTKPGDFFSMSWALNNEILEQYASDRFISFGFNDVVMSGPKTEKPEIFGNLNLAKGNSVKRITTNGRFYDGRYQVSFDMSDDALNWETATRGWVDFIFGSPSFKSIGLKQPLIYIQKKIIV